MINLYFIDTYKTEKNHGLNTYTNELGLYLEKNTGLTFTYVWLNAIGYAKPTKLMVNGVAHLYVPKPVDKQNQAINVDKVLAEVINTELNNNPNAIVHFNWINHLPIAYYLKQHANCKIVLTKHCIPWRDLVTNNYIAFYPLQKALEQGKKTALDAKLRREQIQYDFVDHVITVTQCAKQSLTQLFDIPSNKITVVNNGLSTNVIPIYSVDKRSLLRKKYGFSANDKLVLYAGNVNPRKGIFDVVKAFGKLLRYTPNVRLLIAGPGNYEGIIRLSKGIWGKITLLGSLDKATLYDFYNMADVGIVPSYIEQCSYACIEMMQAGLPLLVSDVDGLREMVNKKVGLRFKVDFKKKGVSLNQKDLVDKLNYLLKHAKEAKQLGTSARKYALQHFSAERMAGETLEVYRKVLEAGGKEQGIKNKDKGQPLVSVLLPVYNAEKYIQQCLASIFRQSYANFELIVVNDGSTDGSEGVIKNYKDSRMVYVKNEINQGVASTLNKGITLAKGKYIARIDADDMMLPDRLQKQVAFMEDNPEYVLLGSGHYIVGENGLPFDRFIPANGCHEIKTTMLFYNCMSHPTVMYRAKQAKELRYSTEFKHCEDYELWLRMSKTGKVANLPEPLVQYRIHKQNTSLGNQKEMQQNVMELLARELDNLTIDYTPQQLLAHCTFGFGVARQYFNSQERIEALNNWLDVVFTKLIALGYNKKAIGNFRKKLTDGHGIYLEKQPKHHVKISVIMPCYNAEKYIGQAIQSILQQTFTDFKLLVIDDGSTDGTANEIRKFKDRRIKYHRLPLNKGNYVARNAGIKMAKGKYIAMMDADDISLPYRLQVQFEYLEKYKSVGCIGGLSEIIDNKGHLVGHISRPLSHKQIKVSFLKDNYLTQSTIMIRTGLLRKYGLSYNESYRYSSDYDFVARVLEITKVHNLEKVLVRYRVHESQISRAKKQQQHEIADQIRKKYLDLLKINYTPTEFALHLDLMRGRALKQEEIEKGMNWFDKLIKANTELNIFDKEILSQFFKDIAAKQMVI